MCVRRAPLFPGKKDFSLLQKGRFCGIYTFSFKREERENSAFPLSRERGPPAESPLGAGALGSLGSGL